MPNYFLSYWNYFSNLIKKLAGGPESFGLVRKAINLITTKDKDIMRFVALNEIIMAPTILIMIFRFEFRLKIWIFKILNINFKQKNSGKCGIFVPFIYYRFICLRYQSRRNPYNRVMFYELRVALEYYTSHQSCPQFVRNLTQRLIGLCIRFAPPANWTN
jgi:hypothetical protein